MQIDLVQKQDVIQNKVLKYKLSYENKNLYKLKQLLFLRYFASIHNSTSCNKIEQLFQIIMIGIEQVLNKIREICEWCYQSSQEQIKVPRNYKNISQFSSPQRQKQIPQVIIKQYLTALDYLQHFIQQLKDFKIEYLTLQQSLQKQQTEIRKHIGIQQQLRIYSEGIKLQLQECQKQKIQLLQNSKITIKNLKLKNQKLFEQITQLKKKIQTQEKISNKNVQNSHIKTKIKQKSYSSSAQRKDSSLKKIVKTEYIERQKHPFVNVSIRKELKYKNQPQIPKHKHHKSTYVNQQPRTSQSKKRHRAQLLQKAKKQKIRASNSKQFDLAMYLSKNQIKKSPYKNTQKILNKNQSVKRTDKHHKSSFQQKSQKFSKHQTEQKHRKQQTKQKQDRKDQNKQKSKSKESKKKIKSKDKIKQKLKQPKKTFNHNRSLFSVSSVQYRTSYRNQSQK